MGCWEGCNDHVVKGGRERERGPVNYFSFLSPVFTCFYTRLAEADSFRPRTNLDGMSRILRVFCIWHSSLFELVILFVYLIPWTKTEAAEREG